MRRILQAAVLLWLTFAVPAVACGTAPDDHCEVALGTYRIAVPEDVDRPGVMVWLHGMGGSADGAMRNRTRIAALAGHGLGFIALDGIVLSPRHGTRRNWAVADGEAYPRDDVSFVAQVLADAAERHGIDPDRVLLAGFSRGGSMVWDIACHRPGLARAYAPVAGAFWEPMVQDCVGPVALFHTHGWGDRVVPLEGRSFRGGAKIQGDVFQSLFVLRHVLGCGNRQPESVAVDGGHWWRHWTDCRAGRIDLMLHPGGHRVPQGWLDLALDWFEERLAEDCVASAQPASGDGNRPAAC